MSKQGRGGFLGQGKGWQQIIGMLAGTGYGSVY